MDDNLPAANCVVESDRLTRIERQLDTIHQAVVGNPLMGHRGLVHRVDCIELKQQQHDYKFVAWSGIVVGIVAVFEFFKSKLFGL